MIGKNVEKLPELTFSTIERSVDAFFMDAANNFNQQNETEKPKIDAKSDVVFVMDPKQDKKCDIKLINSQNQTFTQTQNFVQPTSQPIRPQASQQSQIIFDLITGQTASIQNNQLFTQPQQTPLVILPRNIETPVVSRIQTLQKDTIKSIQPIVIEPFQKVHLTNALNLAGPVVDTNYNTRSNRNKVTNIKPKNDGKIEDGPTLEIFPKKKKVYNRVTPTIRAIYAKEQQNKGENLQQQTNENTPKQDEDTRDVHDRVGDIFDLPYMKSNQNSSNKSDSSDVSLEEICVRVNGKSNETIQRSSKKINKIKRSLNRSLKEDEDGVEECLDEEKNTTSIPVNVEAVSNGGQVTNGTALATTRTLRSRTNSQKKNF